MNLGKIAPLTFRDQTIQTAFRKTPVVGPVRVLDDRLEGDEIGDRRVHGGPRKAVYAYPSEHYEYWRSEIPNDPLPWGSFGENLSTEGILESEVRPGDRLSIGSAILVAVQPRGPCYKLGMRFQDETVVERFLRSGRSGIYLGVERTGTLTADDPIELRRTDSEGPTISEIFAAKYGAPTPVG